MTTTIRHATQDDMLPVFKLVVEFHRDHFSEQEFAPEKAWAMINVWAKHDLHALLVAEKDGQAVGAMAMKVVQPWFTHEDMLVEDFLFVTKAHRGGFAAFRLVRAFVDWGMERRIRHFRAGVSSGFGPTAGRLYEHFGLRHVGGNYQMHLN